MTENIRLEFVDMINENEWMDELSKQKAIQKVMQNHIYNNIFGFYNFQFIKIFFSLIKQLNNMVFKIAYPDYILNDTLMNEIYKNVGYIFVCNFQFSV